MAKWIHFTDNAYNFELLADGGDVISQEYGLFVYKFHSEFPVDDRAREWGREAIIIECPEEFVKLVQTDPLGDDPDRDEYAIPHKQFENCRYWEF
jgi:hypothetical protein